MKTQIQFYELPFDAGTSGELEVAFPVGCEIIGNFFSHEKDSVLLRDATPQIKSRPVVILRFDPDAVRERRRFFLLAARRDPYETPCALTHVCTFVNSTSGEVSALFEAPASSEPLPDERAA